jgi:hypothetical protein
MKQVEDGVENRSVLAGIILGYKSPMMKSSMTLTLTILFIILFIIPSAKALSPAGYTESAICRNIHV